MDDEPVSDDTMKPLLKLAGAIFASLFVIGAISGWSASHAEDALSKVALENARVIPQPNDDFFIEIRCDDQVAYYHRVSDFAYITNPKVAQVNAITTASEVAAAAYKLSNSKAVTAGVVGGGGLALRYESSVAAMRKNAFNRLSKGRKLGAVFVLVVLATGGYAAGEVIFYRPPSCRSSFILKHLRDLRNREFLQNEVFGSDWRIASAMLIPLPPSTDCSPFAKTPCPPEEQEKQATYEKVVKAAPTVLQLQPASADRRAFRELYDVCQGLRAAVRQGVCAYL